MILSLLPLSSLFSQEAGSETENETVFHEVKSHGPSPGSCTAERFPPYRVSFKHREAKGIGYHHGYSTVEAFFGGMNREVFPYVDFRGHVFNNGYLASNLGVGFRRFFSPEAPIFGANLYYDYRNEHHSNFHQLGAGLEALWRRWTARINGYFPVGKNNYTISGPDFSYFSGHNAYLKMRKRFSFIGFNAEVSNRFWERGDYSFDAYAGVYYLNGKYGKNAPGGMVRLVGNLTPYINLEAIGSYDPVFKWIGQGSIALNIPFGPAVDLQGQWRNCSRKNDMENRLTERVQRFEIVPTKSKKQTKAYVDPGTGDPYYFVFVDNLRGSSDGTFEHPYPTLLEAQDNSSPGDIVYVFSGDGTSTGMDEGIALQDYQQLLGSGVSQYLITTQGYLEIPAQSSALPIITISDPTFGAITLANYNVVSGIHGQIPSTDSGNQIILGDTITSARITNCLIDGESFGIAVQDGSGYFYIAQNDFVNSDSINIIFTGSGSSPATKAQILVADNTFQMIDGAAGAVDIVTFNAQQFQVTVTNNSMNNFGATSFPIFGAVNISPRLSSSIDSKINNNDINYCSIGVAVQPDSSGIATGTINSNLIQNGYEYGIYIFSRSSPSGATSNLTISNNIITDSIRGIKLNAPDNYNIIARVSGNSLSDNSTNDFSAAQSGTGTICLELIDNITSNGFSLTQTGSGIFDLAPTYGNTGAITTSGTITNVAEGTCSE